MSTMEVVRQAEARHEEAVLNEVCRAVGIGLRSLQSRERTEELARRRAVVAWVLHERANWSQEKTAAALKRTVRQITRMLRKRRVMSPFRGHNYG